MQKLKKIKIKCYQKNQFVEEEKNPVESILIPKT